MKKRFVAVIALICLPLLALEYKQVVFDLNGGFEKTLGEGKNEFPCDWKLFHYIKDGTASITDDAYRGRRALKIVADPDDGKRGVVLLSKTFPLTAGEAIRLTFVVKGRSDFLSTRLDLYDADGKGTGSLTSNQGKIDASRWKILNFEYHVNAERWKAGSPTSGRLRLGVSRGADIILDDVEVSFQKVPFDSSKFPETKPLVDYESNWPVPDHWRTLQIGDQNFHIAESGNYYRWRPSKKAKLRRVGLLERMIPGFWNLKHFDPNGDVPENYQKLAEEYIDNQWPLFSMEYIALNGNPSASGETLERVGTIHIGDGQPEEPVYRLEPVFHFLGQPWGYYQGFFGQYKHFPEFMKKKVIPRIKQELPFADDPDHEWTKAEMMRLIEIYNEAYADTKSAPMAWHGWPAMYYLASHPKNKCVGVKNLGMALTQARGAARQSGRRKYIGCWNGHEPVEKYGYKAWGKLMNEPYREEQGYDINTIKYYMFKPFLYGANYYVNEGFPELLLQDLDGDGNFKLSPLGRLMFDLSDFSKRHPDRGVFYSPVAFLEGYGNLKNLGSRIPKDDAYRFSRALSSELITSHRHSSSYSSFSPHGDVFDVLMPNPKRFDEKMFDGYKVLFAMGGQVFTPEYVDFLMKSVKKGKTFVVNAADVSNTLPADFLGGAFTNKILAGEEIVNRQTGERILEEPFEFREFIPGKNCEVLYACGERPIVTKFPFGVGSVVVVTPLNMLTRDRFSVKRGGKMTLLKKLLKFTPGFIDELFAGVVPFTVKIRPEDRRDVEWFVHKKGEGWTVTVLDYSLEREPVKTEYLGTASVRVSYPLKAIPFEIVCDDPAMKDVVELYQDRDVNWRRVNGKMTVRETIRGGDVRVYEFQPDRVELPEYERFVNYALNRPVQASSTHPPHRGTSYRPENAVDGERGNDVFWMSARDGYLYKMPQWLNVDLGEVKTIDHVYILLHVWKQQSHLLRRRVYKYVVETSIDGETWSVVVDESKNERDASPDGDEFWFPPTRARYVRITIQSNSALTGAQIVEFEVMGTEKETVKPERTSSIPMDCLVEFKEDHDAP